MSERPCAFHPDRLTGVSCSRCDRPICPDDMVDAPVGIQCPICSGRMREGALGEAGYRVRQRTERWPLARLARRSSATQVLIGLNVGVFLLIYLNGGPGSGDTLLRFGAMPPQLARGEWWRLFTAMFVHVSVLHLLFNMYALFLFGSAMELRHGKLRFVCLFLIAGLLGSAASVAFGSPAVRAGASGGVFGIFGAWIAFFVRHRSAPGARSQLQSMLVLVALNLFIGFSVRGIDNNAHLGGLVAGFVIGTGLELAGRGERGARALVAPASYLAVLIIALALALPHTI